MYLIAIAWLYVVLMMAVAEALSSQGTLLGAIITLVFYGLLPLSVVMYIMGTPMRRRARQAAERAEAAAAVEGTEAPETREEPEEAQATGRAPSATAGLSATAPHGRGHAAGDAVAPEGKEV